MAPPQSSTWSRLHLSAKNDVISVKVSALPSFYKYIWSKQISLKLFKGLYMSNIMHFISHSRGGSLMTQQLSTWVFTHRSNLWRDALGTGTVHCFRCDHYALKFIYNLIHCSLYCCTLQIGRFWPVAQTLYFLLASRRACSSSKRIANNYRCATTRELGGYCSRLALIHRQLQSIVSETKTNDVCGSAVLTQTHEFIEK